MVLGFRGGLANQSGSRGKTMTRRMENSPERYKKPSWENQTLETTYALVVKLQKQGQSNEETNRKGRRASLTQVKRTNIP